MSTLQYYYLVIAVILLSMQSFNVSAKNKDTYPNKVLRSTTNNCWNAASSVFNTVKIQKNAQGSITNLYDSLVECVDNGGNLKDSMKEYLAITTPDEVSEAEDKEKENIKNKKFFGISWGLGLAFTHLNNSVIREITIEDKKIRIVHETSHKAIAMVESHYFFETKDKDFGHGPFVAIGLVGKEGIDPLTTYGAGYMWGWKRDDRGNSWNVGLGVFVDTESNLLSADLSEGDTTTQTDPAKLLKKSDETGLMLMFSANF